MSPASPSADSAREALAAGTLLALLALASGSSAFSSGTADGGSEKRPFRRHDYRLTFKQPYYFNNTIIPFWETFGNTIPSEEYIRLTPSVPGLKGSIWSTQPNKHPEWEVEFSVAVFGRGAAGGEGLAFWYTKDRAQDGPVFGSKDKWDGLGIIFDTYDENASRNSPLVYGVINDGSKELAKIKNPDMIKFGSCFRDYRNLHAPLWVRVSYHDKRLAVDIDIDKKGKSYVLCFEGHDISLPTGYYFGLSALAGKYADDHDAISFDGYELNPKALTDRPLRPHEKERIAQGKAFNVTDETKKHIEEVEHMVEQARHKEEVRRGHAETEDQASLSLHLEETQYYIIESLNALHEKAEHLGAPSKAKQVPADVASRLSAMRATLADVNSELKNLDVAIQRLTLELQNRESFTGSIGSRSENIISQMHNSLQDLQTKFETLHNVGGAEHDPHAEGEATHFVFFAVVFFGLQILILWFLRRKKPEVSKKFI